MFAISYSAYSQTSVVVNEPEFSGQVVYLKSDTEGQLLPKENAQIKTKAGASVYLIGIGSVKSRLHIKGNARRAELSKANSFGGESTNNMKRMNFNAKKYGEDSYLIMLDNLEKGEYGIYITNPNEKDEKNSL